MTYPEKVWLRVLERWIVDGEEPPPETQPRLASLRRETAFQDIRIGRKTNDSQTRRRERIRVPAILSFLGH